MGLVMQDGGDALAACLEKAGSAGGPMDGIYVVMDIPRAVSLPLTLS